MMLCCKVCNTALGVDVEYSVPATCQSCKIKNMVTTPTYAMECSKCGKHPGNDEGLLFRVVNQHTSPPQEALLCLECVRMEVVFHATERKI